MILRGPTAVSPVAATTDWAVNVNIDMVSHNITVTVIPSGGGAEALTDQQAIPAAMLTNLQTYAKGRAEALLAWPNGSSSVLTP